MVRAVHVLVVNVGSSNVKLRLLVGGETVRADDRTVAGTDGIAGAVGAFVAGTDRIDVVGHRVVHGGPDLGEAVEITEDTEGQIAALADLAPLHNPPALAAIDAVWRLRPTLRQVACFDTGFHRDLPDHAATYAIPAEWRTRHRVKRYGFHGLSHAWATRRAGELLDRPVTELRLVTAHVGSGASLAAVAGGRSVDTTMGFTPLEGLVMATRSGSIDPGLLLWLERRAGIDPSEIEDALEHRSGLLGLSENSADLKAVIEAADAGDPKAELAYGVYRHRLRTSIGAMAAAMGGVDGLVFTGGAGEASWRLRTDVCGRLGFLGLEVDATSNKATGDRVISPGDTRPAVMVVTAREDLEIERLVLAVLGEH